MCSEFRKDRLSHPMIKLNTTVVRRLCNSERFSSFLLEPKKERKEERRRNRESRKGCSSFPVLPGGHVGGLVSSSSFLLFVHGVRCLLNVHKCVGKETKTVR